MRIRALRSLPLFGRIVRAGESIDVADDIGRDLVAAGAAVRIYIGAELRAFQPRPGEAAGDHARLLWFRGCGEKVVQR